jgi:hypothetical protein
MAWKPPVNYRTSAVVTPTPEAIEIGADGVALLAEAPADPTTNAMTVTVGGNARTRVTGTPAAGQYRVKTQSVIYADLQPHTEYLPLLEFHSSDAGLSGTCSYYRTGTVVTTELYQSMIDFLRPLTGYASSAEFPAATTDRTQRGCPGDMAFTTGGQLYYSDGTQWFAVAGGAGAQFSRTKTVDAGAAVRVALTKTASADAAVFNSTTKSQDITAQAAVLAHQAQTVSANAEVVYNVQARTQTVSSDAAVKAARTQTATADATLKFAVTKTASADASVYEASSATAVSDNFNRAGPALGSNWTTLTGCNAPTIGGSTSATGDDAGARWSANTFADNQWAEFTYPGPGDQAADPGELVAGKMGGAIVRASSSAKTFYWACFGEFDDGGGYSGRQLRLYKCVAGTFTQLGSTFSIGIGATGVCRLKASGTTISLETASTHGGTYTSRVSVTDSAIASGSAGIYGGSVGSLSDWWGGDI